MIKKVSTYCAFISCLAMYHHSTLQSMEKPNGKNEQTSLSEKFLTTLITKDNVDDNGRYSCFAPCIFEISLIKQKLLYACEKIDAYTGKNNVNAVIKALKDLMCTLKDKNTPSQVESELPLTLEKKIKTIANNIPYPCNTTCIANIKKQKKLIQKIPTEILIEDINIVLSELLVRLENFIISLKAPLKARDAILLFKKYYQ